MLLLLLLPLSSMILLIITSNLVLYIISYPLLIDLFLVEKKIAAKKTMEAVLHDSQMYKKNCEWLPSSATY